MYQNDNPGALLQSGSPISPVIMPVLPISTLAHAYLRPPKRLPTPQEIQEEMRRLRSSNASSASSATRKRLPAMLYLRLAYATVVVWFLKVAEHVQDRLVEIASQPVQNFARILSLGVCGGWVLTLLWRGPSFLTTSVYLREFDRWPGYHGTLGAFAFVALYQLGSLIFAKTPTSAHRLNSPLIWGQGIGYWLTFVLLGITAYIQTRVGVTPNTFTYAFFAVSQVWAVAQMTFGLGVIHERALLVARAKAKAEAAAESARRATEAAQEAILRTSALGGESIPAIPAISAIPAIPPGAPDSRGLPLPH